MGEPGGVFEDLLEANRDHVRSFSGGHLEARPTRRLAVVTCMDARIDPLAALGLTVGEAHVVRTAGARCGDEVMASMRLAVAKLGVDRIAVVAHTECAAGSTDPEGDLATDLRRLAEDPALAGVAVAGFVYDVRTGQLTLAG